MKTKLLYLATTPCYFLMGYNQKRYQVWQSCILTRFCPKEAKKSNTFCFAFLLSISLICNNFDSASHFPMCQMKAYRNFIKKPEGKGSVTDRPRSERPRISDVVEVLDANWDIARGNPLPISLNAKSKRLQVPYTTVY